MVGSFSTSGRQYTGTGTFFMRVSSWPPLGLSCGKEKTEKTVPGHKHRAVALSELWPTGQTKLLLQRCLPIAAVASSDIMYENVPPHRDGNLRDHLSPHGTVSQVRPAKAVHCADERQRFCWSSLPVQRQNTGILFHRSLKCIQFHRTLLRWFLIRVIRATGQQMRLMTVFCLFY